MNTQYFDAEQIVSGEFTKFLRVLMDEAYGDGKYYNDIHIHPEDCGAFVVEWEQINWERHYDYGQFRFVDVDEVIYKEVYFPDNHTEYLPPEEVEERLKEWHKENPEWVKTSYGTWTNTKENEAFKKLFDKTEENK